MHVTCNTPLAILLIGVLDDRGVMVFPPGDPAQPGLMFKVVPLMPVDEQILKVVAQQLNGIDVRKVDIHQDFSEVLVSRQGERATLYLATVEAGAAKPGRDWIPLPQMLRAMPKDKMRLSYLKAWQVLTGGLKVETKAVDLDEVMKHFDS